jgi:hypothetical protein
MPDLVQLDAAASQKMAELAERKEVAAQAAATPLPGPLADAFAIAPEIKVGTWSVGPFLEGHFELLSEIQHPLYDLLIAMFSGKQTTADYFPSGLKMWQLCYLFTHSLDESEKLIKDGAFNDAARKEFKRLPTAVMIKFHTAIIKQVMIASSTAIAFGSVEDEGVSKKNP